MSGFNKLPSGIKIVKTDAFRPWVQKVMPGIYDDTLSYYELLSKVVAYLNQMNDQQNEIIDWLEVKISEQDKDIEMLKMLFISFRGDMIRAFEEFTREITQQQEDFEREILNQLLGAKVGEILQEWFDNGKLAEIINNEVFNMKADKTYVDAELAKKADVTYVDGKVETINTNITNLDTKANNIEKSVASMSYNVKLPLDSSLTPAKGDGQTDDTNALQAFLNAYSNIYIPDGLYMVDATVSLKPKSNQKITFGKNAIIKALPNNVEAYDVLKLSDVSNVQLIKPNVTGDKEEHTGTTGEWGHGISLYGCKNILIDTPYVNKCWGDGIYIGVSNSTKFCENVKIIGGTIEECRRQGLSLISGKRIKLDGLVIKNIKGTAPESGIDIEPNSNDQFLQEIVIKDVYTENCEGSGIELYAKAFKDSSNKVSVIIENHTDRLSRFGFRVREDMGIVDGFIKYVRGSLRDNRTVSIMAEMWNHKSPRVELFEPYIENAPANMGAIYVGSSDSHEQDQNLDVGNIHIIRPKVVGAKGQRCLYFGIQNKFRDLVNCSIIDPIQLDNTGVTEFVAMNTFFGMNPKKILVQDSNEVIKRNITANLTFNGMNQWRHITNAGTETLTIVTATMYEGQEVTLTNLSDKGMGLLVVGSAIQPIGTLSGEVLKTTQLGASITVRKENGYARVTNMNGVWTK